ncbi:MAG TPA: bifunctional tRNA (5-methylaminomethyl-2-thiouridine)(34)-methyltransferase MnmD/FAD-dependent 5-carboxymethylaminomethyl-2-thiouridine(34) oxidoreductase MnmC [Burkholderiales bacterium]|nr:bifunctional tRNA (5-methylaminomethyl-2-thiouridine)(34)-methyltransferase MnmD/FAD-dependent 5-carboxymethylaminomethyl-2-thiouridine(34) oxidoreductase MnmC [Burkholderiales bacterium]
MSDPSLLDWQDGQPVSRLYGDVFFSRTSGIEETRHVFLAQNRLAERWRALAPCSNFILGETGFGTGLNFLCAWQLWQECAPVDAWLHFFSVEKHPLSADELRAALVLWPQLAAQREVLLAQYDDALTSGWHRFVFAASRITLTLAVEDIAAALPQLDVAADAWFLDGFAPSRNPDMWSSEVLDQVALHTKAGGTFATYSAAGEVRRNLQSAGFIVDRVAGHGSKREMLRGELPQSRASKTSKPWFDRPKTTHTRHAIVIGGGLAGVCATASLAWRGWKIDLIERHTELAAEASGNAQGILYARLSGHATPLRDLVIAGYGYSNRILKECALSSQDHAQCGLLQLAFNEDEAKRQALLSSHDFPESFLRAVDRAEANTLCGVEVSSSGLWFAQGGWANPRALCEALTSHPNIRLHLHSEALRFEKQDSDWRVLGEDDQCIAHASTLILAGANDIEAFSQCEHLPLTTIRGQITALPVTTVTNTLKAVVCGESYIAPARHGVHTLGATHKFRDRSTELRVEEHAENLSALAKLLPNIDSQLEVAELDGRAAIRVSSPDYLPIIGPIADESAFNTSYAALSRDATTDIDTLSPWLDGLYVSTAHGSRGLISAPLAGEILAAYLNDEPSPIPKSVTDAVHPSRFLLRDLIRRRSE